MPLEDQYFGHTHARVFDLNHAFPTRRGGLVAEAIAPHWVEVKNLSSSGNLRSRTINYPASSATARNRVINEQHYDCSDDGHDDAADINTGYARAT